MTDTDSKARLSVKAVISFVLGLGVVTALPAMLLGLYSLREINQSDGRLRGRRLAMAAMGLGAIGNLFLLVGLLAIVILHLRERSARIECQENLRVIGIGLTDFQKGHKVYPGATLSQPGLPPERRLSWLVDILPDLKLDAIAATIRLDEAWDAAANQKAVDTSIRGFRCPEDPERSPPKTPGLTNYVGIAGLGAHAATLPIDNENAGFFGYERTIDRDTIAARHGLAETMAVTETRWHTGPWAAGGLPTVRGLDPGQQPYIGPDRPFGGLHPGGLNVLYADGSVRFVTESVEPWIFQDSARLGKPEK